MPSIIQLILIFFLGGTIVLIATVAGKITKNPYIAGVLMTFPAMLLSGALALYLTQSANQFISRYFLGTLPGLAIVAGFAIAAFFFIKKFGFWPGLTIALFIWFILSSLLIRWLSRNPLS